MLGKERDVQGALYKDFAVLCGINPPLPSL